jgi:hypothetical protein
MGNNLKTSLKYCQRFIFCLIFISLFAFGDSAQAADPPLSLADYWEKVEQTRALLASLENVSPETRQTRLLALADEWERITEVTLPDGTQVSVDHTFLAAQLRADPPDLAQLDGLLTTLLAARDAWPQAKHTPADLKPLDSILAQPEFQWSTAEPEQPSLLAQWLQKVREFFLKLLDRLLPDDWLPDDREISVDDSLLYHGANLLRYLLIGLGILVLVLVLAYILRELLTGLIIEAKIEPDAEADGEVLTSDTAFKRAQGLSGTGDYRAAVRYLYLSSLLLLDERGLLRYDRSQTNREYLRSVTHLPKLAGILRQVIEVFDRVWYGYQPLDERDYTHYAAQVAELRRQK